MKIKDLRPKVKEFAYQRMREQTRPDIHYGFTDEDSLVGFFRWVHNGIDEYDAWEAIDDDSDYEPMYKLYPHLRE